MHRTAILVAGLSAIVLAGAGTDIVGRIDTVGGTTYDWQANGPSDQYIYVAPRYFLWVGA